MKPKLDRAIESNVIDSFKDLYGNFTINSIHSLGRVYSDEIIFSDPVHRIEGIGNLTHYFELMCKNLTECKFVFLDELIDSQRAFFKWEMTYRHPSIKSNAELKICGSTYIKYSEKIDVHEDFYDMGAMLYEHLPVVGGAIRMVKSRLKKAD